MENSREHGSTDARLRAAGAAALRACGRSLEGWPAADPALVEMFEVNGDPAAWLGTVHEAITSPRDRSQRGAHYTPPSLVATVIDPVLDELLRRPAWWRDLLVVDPACGAGAFLLHAHTRIAAALSDKGETDPQRAALRHVLGVDRDPWAARLARLALALRADAPWSAPRVLTADALLGPTHGLDDPPDAVENPNLDWRLALPEGASAVVGNPPFLGGKRLATVLGPKAADALRRRRGLSGNVDLSAHFVHLAAELLRPGGHLAFVLTDTIAQGETRTQGLGRLVPDVLTVVSAERSRPWPGDAHVRVALVHAVRGPADRPRTLDGRPVRHISSHLRANRLEDVPPPHDSERPPAFIGCDLKGTGFLFGGTGGHDPGVLDRLREVDPQLHEVVRPYVTGRTLTTRPDLEPVRQVADLTGLELAEAQARHPDLLALLEGSVRPDRASRSADVARAPWWRFWRTRPGLRQAIAPLSRCLVAPVVARHLVFTWQPVDRVFSHKVLVVATDDDHVFGVLQSRLHQHWARALSSTLGDGLNYAPSRCYRTCPLPPRSPQVADAARALYAARRRAAHHLWIGLGTMQSRIEAGDPDPQLRAVARAQQALDQAVLRAWGWPDLDLDDADAVIDRLLEA